MLLIDFVRESNFIEGIIREPKHTELRAHERFLASPRVTVAALQDFVTAVQPDAVLRSIPGLNVGVGSYRAPSGGPGIVDELTKILEHARRGSTEQEVFLVHHRYENLHPFTDGNGRSGRALWLWMMGGTSSRLFFHEWYYQSLRVELTAARPHPNLLY